MRRAPSPWHSMDTAVACATFVWPSGNFGVKSLDRPGSPHLIAVGETVILLHPLSLY